MRWGLNSIRDKAFISCLFVLLVILIGTIGYMLVEKWGFFDSLYMTVITLTTIGYKEVHPLSGAGRAFTLLLVFFGLSVVFYVINNGIKVVIEGELRDILGRRKVEKLLKTMKGHFIICGYGRMGRIICKEFKQKGIPFVVIEKEPQETDADEDIVFLYGDATRDDLLLKAGIQRAKGLISVLSTDAQNLYVVLSARGLNPDLLIVARAGEEGSEQKLIRAGANRVVSPYHIGGLRIAHSVLKPAVVDFIEFATRTGNLELQMEEVRVEEGSPIVDKTIHESGIGRELGVIVVAIKRAEGEMKFNPMHNTVIRAGDTLIAIGEIARLKKLEKLASRKGKAVAKT
jgi:voltage-gated potassium channel